MGAALSVAAGGAAAIGCSSSNSSGMPSGTGGGHDGGTTSGDDASSGTSTGTATSTGGTATSSGGSTAGGTTSGSASSSGGDDGDDGGSDCKDPAKLHIDPAGSIYCGFGADGGSFSCGTGTECCLGGKVGNSYADQVCDTFGQACNNPTDGGAIAVECAQVADCTANGVTGAACCLAGADAPAAVTGCPNEGLKASGGNAVMCEVPSGGAATGDAGAPACANGELQICSSDADCPSGKTCTAFRWKIIELGFCK